MFTEFNEDNFNILKFVLEQDKLEDCYYESYDAYYDSEFEVSEELSLKWEKEYQFRAAQLLPEQLLKLFYEFD